MDKVLRAYGYECTKQRGSHKKYVNRITGRQLIIPEKNLLKKYYVDMVLERIGEKHEYR